MINPTKPIKNVNCETYTVDKASFNDFYDTQQTLVDIMEKMADRISTQDEVIEKYGKAMSGLISLPSTSDETWQEMAKQSSKDPFTVPSMETTVELANYFDNPAETKTLPDPIMAYGKKLYEKFDNPVVKDYQNRKHAEQINNAERLSAMGLKVEWDGNNYGIQGANGCQGPNGYQGQSGYTAFQGHSGYTGFSGMSGYGGGFRSPEDFHNQYYGERIVKTGSEVFTPTYVPPKKEPEWRYCDYCHAPNNPDAEKCHHCGATFIIKVEAIEKKKEVSAECIPVFVEPRKPKKFEDETSKRKRF